jgi:hypothetical protein
MYDLPIDFNATEVLKRIPQMSRCQPLYTELNTFINYASS